VLPTPEDIQLLVSYPWPGNIRELGAVIDRAAILGNGERLDVVTALGVGGSPVVAPIAQEPQRLPQQESAAEFLSLDVAIKQHIEAALRRAGGQIEGARGAAKLLKVNPHTLRSRMRKLGIDWQRFREADLR
jgi:transcriptional regulator with GAF, ATPase, and Fis domain